MNKMESMEIKQLVISMSLPIIISMVIQALYNIVDSIFVAKISSDALTCYIFMLSGTNHYDCDCMWYQPLALIHCLHDT